MRNESRTQVRNSRKRKSSRAHSLLDVGKFENQLKLRHLFLSPHNISFSHRCTTFVQQIPAPNSPASAAPAPAPANSSPTPGIRHRKWLVQSLAFVSSWFLPPTSQARQLWHLGARAGTLLLRCLINPFTSRLMWLLRCLETLYVKLSTLLSTLVFYDEGSCEEGNRAHRDGKSLGLV